jgi:hypothetical protein
VALLQQTLRDVLSIQEAQKDLIRLRDEKEKRIREEKLRLVKKFFKKKKKLIDPFLH